MLMGYIGSYLDTAVTAIFSIVFYYLKSVLDVLRNRLARASPQGTFPCGFFTYREGAKSEKIFIRILLRDYPL